MDVVFVYFVGGMFENFVVVFELDLEYCVGE